MKTIRLHIDGKDIETEEGKNVLDSSLAAGIYIPHLCYHQDLSPVGVCRLCIVEIEGMEGLQTSCTIPARDGMVIRTKGGEIDHMRRLAMELMLSGHPEDCGTCVKYLNCELQSLKQYLIGDHLTVRRRSKLFPVSSVNPLFLHDPNKCVLCSRCVRACHELRGVGVLLYRKKGEETYIGTARDLTLAEAGCRFCGACAEVCPTGAIMDKEGFAGGKNRRASLVPCRYSCPAEIDVPRYIRFIREKNYTAATAVIREKVPFPRVLGYVCDRQCEKACRRGAVNQAVSIRNLKRYASEHDNEKLWNKTGVGKPPTGKRVAVVGSGPAGLTAAYYLANQGHSVVVFESLPLAGGMLRYGIPEYRLPRSVLDREIADIVGAGVEIKTKARVESIDALLTEGYDAVLVAIGADKGLKLPIPGVNGEDVLISTDFLRMLNKGEKVKIGKRVIVLGGGNVAFDCARVARRLGAVKVLIACLEARAGMLAANDEVDQGVEEGIEIYPSRTFTTILREDGEIRGVEFLEVESFSFDDDHNLQIEPIEGSKHVLECDTVIFAVGQKPELPAGFGLDTTSGGLIELDPYTLVTSREEVFAAGDAVSGGGAVVKAIASGRKAAAAIDRFLGGQGNIDEKLAPSAEPGDYLGPGEGFAAMARCEEKCLPAHERIQDFRKVDEDMDEDEVENEAKRCFQCDLRLKIKSVKFWGSY